MRSFPALNTQSASIVQYQHFVCPVSWVQAIWADKVLVLYNTGTLSAQLAGPKPLGQTKCRYCTIPALCHFNSVI